MADPRGGPALPPAGAFTIHGVPAPLPALLLGLGLALGGWLAGQGIVQARKSDRFVTVNGLTDKG